MKTGDSDGAQGASLWARARPWYGLAILVVAILFGYIDRQIIILVVEPIKRDLQLNDLQIGAIQGLGPSLFAVIAGFPLAWLADRVNRSRLLAACILFWSAATAARAFADGFGELMIFTIGVVVGEAVLTPVMYSLIPDLFTGRRREIANFIMFASISMGLGVALMLGGLALQAVETLRPSLPGGLSELADWRLAFLLVAAPGMVIAALVLGMPSERREHAVASAEQGAPPPDSLSNYLRNYWKPVLMIYGGSGLYAFAFTAIGTWLPVAIIRDLGAPAAEAGLRYGSTFTVSAGCGILLAMACAGFWRRVAPGRHVLRALSVSFALSLFPLTALAFVTSPGQAYLAVGAAFLILIHGTSYTPTMLQDMSPPQVRARVMAIAMILYAGLGACGPMAVGLVSDLVRDDGVSLMTVIVALAAPSLLCAAILYRKVERPYLKMSGDFASAA